MEKQPLLLVLLADDGKKKLINEAQVVSVEEREHGNACLRMSNGDEIIIKSPNYEAWENDYHSRK